MSALGLYLDMLTGAEPEGSYVELRHRLRNGAGMGREFFPVRDPQLTGAIDTRGCRTDLYVGVAPRVRQEGNRAAIERSHALHADLDTREAAERLQGFDPQPSMIVRSGSCDHLHAYWALWPPAAPDEAERANRRLALTLGGDPQVFDAARILRPPGTFNFKSHRPVRVTVAHWRDAIFAAAEVVGDLPDPPGRKGGRPQPRAAPLTTDDPLRGIPPAVYVEALTGLEVGRDQKIACPFHEDRTPSLHVYDAPSSGSLVPGWKCYGCGRGGSIIDFGAALYGIGPRGAGYHQIRKRLEADLRGRAAA